PPRSSDLIAAGLLARKAVARGLVAKPWVKTSLAPGSQVVTSYLEHAGLLDDLAKIGFYVVGYGCTTCIGNSGPIDEALATAIKDHDLLVGSVLSGNRNFEGRVHPWSWANFLASPPLVVAYALAGTVDLDLGKDPIATDAAGKPVYLRDLWPSSREVGEVVAASVQREMFQDRYAQVFDGTPEWRAMKIPEGSRFRWDDASTYIRRPPYFDGMTMQPPALRDVEGARVLALLGDSITTDHISPAGNIAKDSPAARYLGEHGVEPRNYNSYGSRRGNHEVMVRGTFANIRLRNRLAPGTEGGVTLKLPEGTQTTIYDAAMAYQAEGV